ncbi:MATE family efflux transporter [Dysgonomonas sp. Marseille-P4677]|uniref:MATE family efflux transporter n=1 Tax=Dysgonomonas sp. Marseille-P4677 TaxID=2364790 RepID=UPI0019142923|nr:MATE family efflux transporter [Dysgonomonas sp. Marseille-P4677]MBK5719499.1 MATE family efflux transporter [Dysgonomonas sp. Marseille-P4677]
MHSYSYKDIWKVSAPIMLGLLAQNIVQLTATIFLGQVGEVEQSASGLAGIYYIAFFTLCFGFSIGGQIMISRRNGEQNYNKIGSIVIQGIIFLEVLALLLFTGSSLMSKYILPGFMDSPEVYAAVDSYLSWRIFGFFFASINVMFRAFYVGIARTPVLTMNAIVMAVVNFAGDYILIFGNFGFPKLGIAGAGMAAVISEIASVLFFVIYTLRTVDLKKYGFMKMKFRFSIVKSILSISSFTMIQYLISMSTWFLFFMAIEQHSARALAITNIVRNFYMLFFIPMNALATTANTLVGNTMGAGQIKDVIPLVKRICKLSLGVIAIVMLITGIGAEFWISLIASHEDISLIPESVTPLLVVVFALPICSISTVVFNSISGTGNTRAALYLEIITLILYVLYMYWIVIYKEASVAVSWSVEYVYWGCLLFFSFLYLRYGKWQLKKI